MAARNEEIRLHVLHSLQQVFCTLDKLYVYRCKKIPMIYNVVVGIQTCPIKGIKCQNKFCIHHKEVIGDNGGDINKS